MPKTIPFYKYQGTGNDFVIIDLSEQSGNSLSNLSPEFLAMQICDRHFGVGSDGLILIKESTLADFEMDFLNPDGSRSFCGNGSRCAVMYYSRRESLSKQQAIRFLAVDGIHKAELDQRGLVSINLSVKNSIEEYRGDLLLNTGSPHYLRFLNEMPHDIVKEARELRYSDDFEQDGINVNFITVNNGELSMRTYERGVEDETLSCGTGVTAAALGAAYKYELESPVKVNTKGGPLEVSFSMHQNHFKEVRLTGPAELVFNGNWIVNE